MQLVKVSMLITATIFVMALAVSANAKPLVPARHGNFKHYVLALTWQPGFCHNGSCDSNQSHNVLIGLHGLWASRPQVLINRGIKAPQWWHKGCDYFHHSNRAPNLASETKARLSKLMPQLSHSLLKHEYDKHVQCFGFGAEAFFSKLIKLRNDVADSMFGAYLKDHKGKTVSHNKVRAAFTNAFNTAHSDSLQLRCNRQSGQAVLSQIWVTIHANRLNQFPASASFMNAPQDNCPAQFEIPSWN